MPRSPPQESYHPTCKRPTLQPGIVPVERDVVKVEEGGSGVHSAALRHIGQVGGEDRADDGESRGVALQAPPNRPTMKPWVSHGS